MPELSKADVRDAMREVLSDKELLQPILEPIIVRVVIDKMADKFERTFGVDFTNHEEREETRKDMEFIRESRIWAQSEDGKNDIAALKRLMKAINGAMSRFIQTVVYFLLAGLVALITMGIATHSSFKSLLSRIP